MFSVSDNSVIIHRVLETKKKQLGKIIFSLYIWYLNKCFPSHSGERFLILHFSACFPHQYWNSTIGVGEGQISISLTLIMRPISALLWALFVFRLSTGLIPALLLILFLLLALLFFLILFSIFSHALFCIIFSPWNLHHFCILPQSFSFLLDLVSSLQNSLLPPPRFYISFQVLPFDGDPSYSINQHLKKKPQQISFLYKPRLSLKRLFFIATQNMLPLILQFHQTQGHKK